MILFCHIRRHIISVCTRIGKARFDCSVKVENFPCTFSYTLHIYACMSGQYKNATTLYQFFCRLLFSHIIFVKFILVSFSSSIFHCCITAHYMDVFAYSPTDGYLGCFWILVANPTFVCILVHISLYLLLSLICIPSWVERYTQLQTYWKLFPKVVIQFTFHLTELSVIIYERYSFSTLKKKSCIRKSFINL